MKRILFYSLCLLLTACGDSNDDLREFVKNSGKGLHPKIAPLPQVKSYEPYNYQAFDIPDPFKPRKLKQSGGGGLQPDVNRPKELLENYPLENLKMVGVIQQGKVFIGVIKTPDNNLYQVKVSNHMGQNYGKIAQISDSEILLKETVQDTSGDWIERENHIQLQE